MKHNLKLFLNWFDNAELSEFILGLYIIIATFLVTLAILHLIYDTLRGWMKSKVRNDIETGLYK